MGVKLAGIMNSVNLRGLLFDMDGVLYNDDAPIPGAAETMAWVQSRGIPHLFVTNTSSRSRAMLVDKLRRFGIETDREHILTPCAAAAVWLKAQAKAPIALFVREAAQDEFAGLPLVANGQDGCAAVVIGDLGEGWTYDTLNRAFRLLHFNPEAKLVALGMTRYWQTKEGLCLDVAPFVAALEHATGRQPLVFGKPADAFFKAAADRLDLRRDEILMIGDDVRTDVGGAQAAGLRAALVKTGKFAPADLSGAVRPDVVMDSIVDVPQWWAANVTGRFERSVPDPL